jgi:predicted nucleic acid-binding protein
LLIVKDSMVLIHLAKSGLLKEACIMFEHVIIPPAVHREVVERGIAADYPDAYVVQSLEEEGQIRVVTVKNKLLAELKKYGLQGGELEAVTLYFQEKTDLIASNDDKVRKLRLILDLKLVSSPEIILMLAKQYIITKDKATECLEELKKIGWFSNSVIDYILSEVDKIG